MFGLAPGGQNSPLDCVEQECKNVVKQLNTLQKILIVMF
jgi:hypothetical protein